tara:strand:- start:6443 stop:7486 length:1044 start_codon:yes stop_codon:yes gene_type:complete
MGLSQSKTNFKETFNNELSILKTYLNNIISINGLEPNAEYTVSYENLCEKFTYVVERKLHRHQKVYIEELHDNVIIIPRTNSNKNINKSEICSAIANHYNRVLRLVHAMRWILDIENNSNYSIAGIGIQNINQIESGLVEIQYCDSKQYHNYVFKKNGLKSRKLDLSQLMGFKLLMNNILSKEESHVFYKLMSGLLRSKRLKLSQADKLLMKEFGSFNDEIITMNKELQKGGNYLQFDVSEKNMIFSNETCYVQKKFIVQKSKSLQAKLNKQENDVIVMIKEMYKVLKDLTVNTDDGVEFKVLTHAELNKIELKIKRLFMIFYLQSIVNYNLILDTVEKMPNLNSTN